MVLKFELPNAQILNFPQNSAQSHIGPVLINGDCVYLEKVTFRILRFNMRHPVSQIKNRIGVRNIGAVCSIEESSVPQNPRIRAPAAPVLTQSIPDRYMFFQSS